MNITRPKLSSQLVGGLTVALALTFGPGIVTSYLTQGDLPGHLETIRWIGQHAWPLPWSWDPRFFAGAPVGILYPPLFAWLGGGIALVTGAEAALKFLLLTSILLLPLSLFEAGRGLGLRTRTAAWSTLTALAVLWLPFRGLGGSLHQTLVAGNASNALALVLFGFFLGRMRFGLLRPGKSLAPATLLGLTILCHFLVGAAAGVALCAVAAIKAVQNRSGAILRRGVWIAAGGLGIAAPFLLPFLVHLSEASSHAIAYSPRVSFVEWTVLGVSTLLILLHPRRWRHPLFPFLVLAVLFYFLRGVLIPLFGAPPVRMEYHRFRLFLYLLLVPSTASLLQLRLKIPTITVKVAGISLLVLLGGLCLFAGYDARGPLPIAPPGQLNEVNGKRILVLASPSAQNGAWHALQHSLPRSMHAYGLKGLFVEGAVLSRTVFELEKVASGPQIRPRWWAIRTASGESLLAEDRRVTLERFQALGIDRVISREPVSRVLEELTTGPARSLQNGFVLYTLPEAPFARRLGDDNVPGERVEVKVDDSGSRVALNLAEGSRVVLAMAHFSDWRVYSGEAAIDQTKDGRTMVSGSGPVVLQFAPRIEEQVGLFIGLACMIGMWAPRVLRRIFAGTSG